MRVGGQALAVDLLAEVLHLLFADAAFHERAGVDAGRGMALEEDQVTAVFLGRRLEEVVEADVVERRTGGEGGNVATQIRVLLVGAHDHRQGVPADQRANAAFHEQVAGHAGFVGHRNGVAIRCSDGVRQRGAAAAGQLTKPGHQVVRAVFTLVVEDGLQRVEPFLGFEWINIIVLHCGLQTLWALQVPEAVANLPIGGCRPGLAKHLWVL